MHIHLLYVHILSWGQGGVKPIPAWMTVFSVYLDFLCVPSSPCIIKSFQNWNKKRKKKENVKEEEKKKEKHEKSIHPFSIWYHIALLGNSLHALGKDKHYKVTSVPKSSELLGTNKEWILQKIYKK